MTQNVHLRMLLLAVALLVGLPLWSLPPANTMQPEGFGTKPIMPFVGVWSYDKPCVEAKGTTLFGKIGKPIAIDKMRSKVNKAFKKLKIKQHWHSIEFTADGQWVMDVSGSLLHGNYEYSDTDNRLTLKWHGLPMHCTVKSDKGHLNMLFEADRVLGMLRLIMGFGNDDAFKSLTMLTDNYRDVMIGFDLKH